MSLATEIETLIVKHLNDMLIHEDYFSILEHESTRQVTTILEQKGLFSREQQPLELINLKEIASLLNLDANDLRSIILTQAAALLQLFVVSNFTGPRLDQAPEYEQLIRNNSVYDQLNSSINHENLSIDSVNVYHLIYQPWLLFLVKQLMSVLDGHYDIQNENKTSLFSYYVWTSRYFTIYSLILLDPVESLLSRHRALQDQIYSHFIVPLKDSQYDFQEHLEADNISPVPVELCCELVQSSLLRDDITMARKFLDSATKISGICIEATGILGKRTRFQQKEVAQLVIKVNQKPKDPNLCQITITDAEEVRNSNLPIDVKLDCDTLLPEIQFTSKEGNQSEINGALDRDLSVQSQILLLSMLNVSSRSEAVDENVAAEYSAAYLHTILKSSTIWSVSYKALVQRCNIEKKVSRKIDRALLQMEELIKLTTSTDLSQKKPSHYFGRLRLFYSVLCQPIWSVQQNYGEISMDLGLFKNALDIFLRIDLWEKAIACYQVLNMNHKAEALIRRELAKNETPYLYCLLGDATEDIKFYEKAWDLSKMRYARAQKSLGSYYYVRKRYEDAIKHYEMAVKVNPSNTGVLYMLAYSYLIEEKYELAAQCYRNITQFDDSSFLAWNNLSKAYIKLKQKERAWRTLNEAIKCNFEEWRIWENFMLVCTDIGAFDDVVKAWHRLIDLKSSHEDDQVLEILTNAIVTDTKDIYGDPSGRLIKKAIKLIARLHATSASSSCVWICYYKLLIRDFQNDFCTPEGSSSGDYKSTVENLQPLNKNKELNRSCQVDKIAHALQRAIPSKLTADRNWFCITEKVLPVLETYNQLAECHIEAYNNLEMYFDSCHDKSGSELKSLLTQMASFRMSLNNICRTVSRKINDTTSLVTNSEIVLNIRDETGNSNNDSEPQVSAAQRQQSLIDSLIVKKDTIQKLISSSNMTSPRTG